jgi:hypothetical protein
MPAPIERRKSAFPLTDDQIEEIAERAAEKAVQKMTDQIYLEVGKGVVKKALYLIGAFVVGAGLWAKAKGWMS